MKTFVPALVLLALFTVTTGVIYPVAVTGLALLFFHEQAEGSLISNASGVPVGSKLIGQPFDDPRFFWSRPSATGPFPYNGGASTGSNLGPLNPALKDAVAGRVEALRASHPEETGPVPPDLVMTSGSGLDPHISPAAARYQVARVARVRGLPVEQVRELVGRHEEARTLGFLGERRVNVLELNLELEVISSTTSRSGMGSRGP